MTGHGFTIWRCEKCGQIAHFYPGEAEPGTQIICDEKQATCDGLMSQVEVVSLATHQALEARVRGYEERIERCPECRASGVSAFNDQPTEN